MKHFFIIASFCVYHTCASAQEVPVSARAAALGGSAVTLQDSWSIFQNVAGLGTTKEAALLFGYENRFHVREGLHTVGAGGVMPIKAGACGLGVSRFGDQFFSIHTLSTAYGHRINQFSLGVRINQRQYKLEGFGTRHVMLVDIGGIATLTPALSWGLHLKSLNRPLVSRLTEERAPSVLQSGLAYRAHKALMLNLEAEQEISQPVAVKAGAEYKWKEKLSLRTGFNQRQRQHYFGMGLSHRIIGFDYALSTHAVLGMTHYVSLAYQLKEK